MKHIVEILKRTIASHKMPIVWTLGVAILTVALAFVLRKFPFLRLATALVATSVFLIVLLWLFPKWQVRSIVGLDSRDRFDRENEARKTLSQILGGLILLIGFYFTWQNLKATQENLEATKHSQAKAEEAAQQNLYIAQEGQITDRFTKAIAQLGDTKLEIRLGGIYALERIAKDSPKDHWPIMEVLTAYIREHAKRTGTEKPWPEETGVWNRELWNKEGLPRPAPDIQAILAVLSRRTLANERWNEQGRTLFIDLHGTDLRGAEFWNADLTWANFAGANLSGADLDLTHLWGVNLTGAQLTAAGLSGVDLSRADLVDADLSRANLLGSRLAGTDLTGATLRGANLRNLHLISASLSRADLTSAILAGAELRGSDLRDAKGLSPSQLESAWGDAATKVPYDIPRPKSWH